MDNTKNNKSNKRKKKKKWIKLRHRIVKAIAWFILTPYSRLKYGIKVKPFKEQKNRNYLVISNHQTAFDQFFVGMAFRKHLYYVASEDLFSNGFISRLIKFLVNPIPIKKSTNDVKAVMDCLRVSREGGSIALFPEGNRTYSGKTEYIKPSVAQLAKALRLPLAIYRIEGGYGVHPRWSDVVRKGPMNAYVSKVIEPEEYMELSNEELYDLICKELYVNDCNPNSTYKSKKSAEYLERAMYYCPKCGLSEWESHGNTIFCKKCGLSVDYTPTTELICKDDAFQYKYVTEWYDAQCKFIEGLDLSPYANTPIYEDNVSYTEVIPYKRKNKIAKKAILTMYGDRFTIKYNDTLEEIKFDNIMSMAALGKNKLNLYIGTRIFQFKSHKRFCALKYMNIYFHYCNLKKGIDHGEFLGL